MFGETRYAARSWGRKRRVIMKAEVVQYPGRAPRDNPRFVVTNLLLLAEAVYTVYRQRGDVENRYKELKDSLGLGRTSCPRFLANQFRVLLTAIAYVLFQTLQQYAQRTAAAGAQVSTLRERLIKLAVYITRSGRLTVALLSLPPPTTSGMVSLPDPIATGPRTGLTRPQSALTEITAVSTFAWVSDAAVASPRAVRLMARASS